MGGFFGAEDAGFVDDTREFFNDGLTVKFFRAIHADEGEMGTAKEFFHVLGAATGGFRM